MKGLRGFTLAEVLITLGVIGVVASMTLPTLINNFQVSSWENSLKKSYSTITNGFHALATEYDGDLRNSGIFDDIDDATFSNRIDEAVKKHFKVIKSCKIGDTTNCPGYFIKELKGINNSHENLAKHHYFKAEQFYVAYLADGTILSMKDNKKCAETPFSNNSNFKHDCVTLFVDTNAEKGPNARGKDVFQLGSIDEKGNIYTHTSLEWAKANYEDPVAGTNYWHSNLNQCGTPATKLKDETIETIYGQNCLARIMENGWKMDYLR